MNSIRRTLLLWLSLGITLGIALAAALVYRQARAQADELFDYQMKQMLGSLPVPSVDSNGSLRGYGAEQQEDIVIQMWDNNGLRIYRSSQHTLLPQRTELGFTNVLTNGAQWRVYSVRIGNTIVQAAQPVSARAEVAAQMALRTATPLLVLLPVLALLIWITVGKSLGKLKEVADEVGKRDANSLEPITVEAIPREIVPLTASLNDLLARLRHALLAQRNFVADAAHELKTPLTALKLQRQLAERADSEAERAAAFADLDQGIERASHLVQQLLTLARHEPGAAEPLLRTFDLAELTRNTVAEFAGMANANQIDLGFVGVGSVTVNADAPAIQTMLSNLIDNALRYSPAGSRVDVTLNADRSPVSLSVADNGPGIPEEELARVCDRFYRVPGTQGQGSGLGLAIVHEIAAQQGISISLVNRHPGLEVTLQFISPIF